MNSNLIKLCCIHFGTHISELVQIFMGEVNQAYLNFATFTIRSTLDYCATFVLLYVLCMWKNNTKYGM